MLSDLNVPVENPLDLLKSKEWFESKRFRATAGAIALVIALITIGAIVGALVPNLQAFISIQVDKAIEFIKWVISAYVGSEAVTGVARQVGVSNYLKDSPSPNQMHEAGLPALHEMGLYTSDDPNIVYGRREEDNFSNPNSPTLEDEIGQPTTTSYPGEGVESE